MSWSVNAIGKPKAVAEKTEKDFVQSHVCDEPEETVRQAARAAIAAALAGNTNPAVAVQVTASGHMGKNDIGEAYNDLSIHIAPIYGFVE